MSQRTMIITGASRGLGAAMASLAAQRDANVALIARSPVELERTADEIRRRGGTPLTVVGDITRAADCRRIIDQTMRTFGRIDALINNAGTIEPFALISEVSQEDWAHAMAVNALAPLMLCRLAIPYLRKSRGRVINVTSHGAELAIPGGSAYSASKAALNQLSRTLAAEETDITVVLFIPGEVDTAMQAVIRDKANGKTSSDVYQYFVDLKQRGQLLPPETPALAAVCLALKAPREWSGEILEWDDERVQALVKGT